MIRFILRRLYRDRRRYAVVAALLFSAGLVTFWGVRSSDFGVYMPVIAGVAFLLGIGIFAPLLCLVIPAWRTTCEVVAFGLFAQACIGRVVPEWSLLERDNTQSIWFIIAVSFLAQLYGSPFIDKWFKLVGFSRTTTARSRLDAATLFDGIVGRPEAPERLAYADSIVSFERDKQDPLTLTLTSKMIPLGTSTEVYNIKEEQVPVLRVQDWKMVDADDTAPFTSGTLRVEIEDTGKYRRIRHHNTFDRYPSRGALLGWIDDGFGRFMDDWIRTLEKRAKSAPASSADALPA